MTYIKNIWVDQEVERPKTYEMTNNSDGSVTLIDSFGLVSELGTPVNADNMNHIEDGIENNDQRITVLEGEGARADTSLSNLTAEGEKHFLNYSQVTNCILEIPQRIKYTLEDGVLTIKAGSVVIVPYGTETPTLSVGDYLLGDQNENNFKIVDIQYNSTDESPKLFYWCEVQRDVSSNWVPSSAGEGGIRVMYLPLIYSEMTDSTLTIHGELLDYCDSGTSNSISGHYSFYYNTATNFCQRFNSSTIAAHTVCSLPVLLNHYSTTSPYTNDYVKQVLNGMGFIGTTFWVDKGIKALAPDGRNEDGTLRNIEFVTQKLILHNNHDNYNISYYLGFNEDSIIIDYMDYFVQEDTPTGSLNYIWYKPSENIIRTTADLEDYIYKVRKGVIGAFLHRANGKIINFSPNLPFVAADWLNVVKKSGDTMTGTLNITKEGPNLNAPIRLAVTPADNEDNLTDIIALNSATNIGLGGLRFGNNANGLNLAEIYTRNTAGEVKGTIGVYCNESDTITTKAPTPPSTSNDTNIATTAWVRARIIKWESGWFSLAKSASYSWNLSSAGMDASNSNLIVPEILGKVVTADGNYAVNDIVYGQWSNYVGSASNEEMGYSLTFTGSTLMFSAGNEANWTAVKKGGGKDNLLTTNCQFKIILRRYVA